jgi:hypothetical protein
VGVGKAGRSGVGGKLNTGEGIDMWRELGCVMTALERHAEDIETATKG